MTLLRFGLLLLCLSLTPLGACVRQQAEPGGLEVLHSGRLETDSDTDIPETVYVNVRDTTNRVFGLRAQTESWLQRKGFTAVANPSEAGHILQLTLLAAGPVNPEGLRAVVDAGYGSQAQLTGKGGTALVADILHVQRRVPSAKRPSREKLKSISSRNAIANSQMRVGVLARRDIRLDAGLPPQFAEALARELSSAFPDETPGGEQQTPGQTPGPVSP